MLHPIRKSEVFERIIDTPMQWLWVFVLSDEEKIKKIEFHFIQILDTLGPQLNRWQPEQNAAPSCKMYVKEIFSGFDPKNKTGD